MAQPALAESTIRHAVLVERLKAGEARKFEAFLREIDRNLREQLTRGELTTYKRRRLEALLAEIDAMLAEVLGRFTGQLDLQLREFAEYEAGAAMHALDNAGIAFALPAAEQLWAAVKVEPLQAGKGKLLAGFIKDWTQAEREAVTGAIRLGVAQGQTTAEIVKAIRGTAALKYADGLLAVTKRNAEAVVLTSVAHVGAVARNEAYAANADIFAGSEWDATLDHRTCVRCQALDGKRWALSEGPTEPLHVRCRCVRTPVLTDEFAWLTKGEKRASVDGPVSGRLSYYQWLKRQDAAFQDAALGPTRGKLLREGGLSAERFAALQLDRKFEPLTLAEMKELEPKAFKRAGLK